MTKRIQVDRNVWKWSDKCNGCRTLGTAININNWWEARRSQSHYSDRRVTIEEIVLQLGISQGTAYSLVHDILGFHKVAASWVPRHLTEEHKRNRQHICSSLLERYNREGDNFLNCIITGDETWVHHYEPETKRQSMQWKHTSSPSSKNFKSQPSAGKLLLTVFWDSQGPILEHYMEKDVTVTSVNGWHRVFCCYTTMHALI